MGIDPRAPCLIGVGQRTWHSAGAADEAPEPLAMWGEVCRAAAADAQASRGADAVLAAVDSLQVVYCQSWQYDDPPGRLAEALTISPRHRHYSGIGGTTPQVLVDEAASAVLRGECDLALVTGAEALDTKRRLKKLDRRPEWSFRDPERKPFPFEAPFHPAEVSHEVFQAWLTFAVFDVARRAHRQESPEAHRRGLGALFAPFSEVAAGNPYAWFRQARTADELITPTAANRMVGYPYTKYLISVMDVDMAGALLLASHETADRLGVPADRRVYLRGWCYATDPVYVAQHRDLWRSPGMAAASAAALSAAGTTVDEVSHFDLYSCFPSSVAFAIDALGLDPADPRGLTVTGGLPFAGGAGSNYLTHSIATMAETLRADPGSVGVVSGVGMHMTKHVYAVYSTTPGPVRPADERAVQASLDAAGEVPICDVATGTAETAEVAAYSVVHGRDGAPSWGLVVCDLPTGARAYGRVTDPHVLSEMERVEFVGTPVELVAGEGGVNLVKV